MSFEFLKSFTPPWLGKFVAADARISELVRSEGCNGVRVVVFDGGDIDNSTKFYDDVSSKLDFPDYFGRNLNALFDCLADPDFIPEMPHLFLIYRGELFLRKENTDAIEGVLHAFARAGEEWSQPRPDWRVGAIPFHTVVQLSKDTAQGPYAELARVELK